MPCIGCKIEILTLNETLEIQKRYFSSYMEEGESVIYIYIIYYNYYYSFLYIIIIIIVLYIDIIFIIVIILDRYINYYIITLIKNYNYNKNKYNKYALLIRFYSFFIYKTCCVRSEAQQ